MTNENLTFKEFFFFAALGFILGTLFFYHLKTGNIRHAIAHKIDLVTLEIAE